MAAVAKGKAGGALLIGPSSCIRRFTMPRAGRPLNTLVSAVWRAAALCSASTMHRTCGGLRTQQIRGADLDSGGTQRHGCRHAVGIRNAASSNYRALHRLDQLWHQGKRAHLGCEVVGQEHTTMATRLQPLGNNGIDALRVEPACFRNRGC